MKRHIKDVFHLKFTYRDGFPLPIVEDNEGRVDRIKKKLGRKLVKEFDDLHVYPHDGSFCLCLREDESRYLPKGRFDFDYFISNLLIPHLYWLSHCEKYKKQPWKGLSHRKNCAILQLLSKNTYQTRTEMDARLQSFCDNEEQFDTIKQVYVNTNGTVCPFCTEARGRCMKSLRQLNTQYSRLPD